MKPQPISAITTSQDASAKHTPGPWTIELEDGIATIRHSDGKLSSHVAKLFSGALCEEHGRIEVNARLIAAAPELLEALKELLSVSMLSSHERMYQARADAREAISKAEGK